jgi:hypothetical protein
MTVDEALAVLVSNLGHAVGPLVGFLSGWGLFEIQERRKQSLAVRSVRQSLVAELKWLESQASMAVIRCANQSNILSRGIQEFRWFLREGAGRNMLDEIPPELIASRDTVLSYPDEEITKLVKIFRHESQATELPATVINSVLGAPTSAELSAEEIKRLLQVKWQLAMLATEARNMTEFLRLTFSVTDEANHNIVKANHASSLRMYGKRAAHLLDYVRAALKELQTSRVND